MIDPLMDQPIDCGKMTMHGQGRFLEGGKTSVIGQGGCSNRGGRYTEVMIGEMRSSGMWEKMKSRTQVEEIISRKGIYLKLRWKDRNL